MIFSLHLGDCLEYLRAMASDSVDSFVTDSPYGLSEHKPSEVVACLTAWLAGDEYRPRKKGFMGHSWDSWVPGPEVWREVFRVLKPGGHVVTFAGSRTHDLMSIALRIAGFECRDTIMWVYGSGFPKSRDISKDLDKRAGAKREVVGMKHVGCGNRKGEGFRHAGSINGVPVTEPVSEAARQWDGWGTALKPAFEPALVFRKPLCGTVAQNVLQHGTGALNIGACRVPYADADDEGAYREKCVSVIGASSNRNGHAYGEWSGARNDSASDAGRWPANVMHDGSAEVLAMFPDSNGAGGSVPNVKVTGYGDGIGTGKSDYLGGDRRLVNSGSGSAARFFPQFSYDLEDEAAARLFYCAKASRSERNEGCEHMERKPLHWSSGDQNPGSFQAEGTDKTAQNNHPTVKPSALMAYLARLVTPAGGTVVDLFMGSGSTGKACMREGFNFIGIELDPEYFAIAEARIKHEHTERTRQGTLDLGAAA